MRKHGIATWAAVALCAGCAGTGGSPSASTAAIGSGAGAAAVNYGPVQPASWTDRVQSAVVAPFRAAADPPAPAISPSDPLLLSKGSGPATPELFISMAAISERAGDAVQARQLYQEALKLDERHIGAMLGMARLEDRHGRLEEARRWYQQAANVDPRNAAVANDFGLCLARAGRLQEALPPLGQAVSLDPQKALYRNNIAKVLVALDRPAEAAEHLAAAHAPAAVNYNMAVLLIDHGRIAEGVRCLHLATTMDPQLTAANDLLAEITGSQGRQQSTAANPQAPLVANRTLGPADLSAAIAVAAQEAQPWPAISAATDDSVLPTASQRDPAANANRFSEPVLLPAVD